MDLPVVDFHNHGPLTMYRFHICKRRLRVKEEFLPRIRRTFRNEKTSRPYPGYKTQRPFENRPNHEKNPLAVERTKQVVEKFQESDELMLNFRKEELDGAWKEADGKWWELKHDPDEKIAEDHYFDLKQLFNEELHQKYWEDDEWFKLWDHATSDHGYLPINW